MSSALKRRMDRLSPPSGKAFSRNFRGGTKAELDAYLERSVQVLPTRLFVFKLDPIRKPATFDRCSSSANAKYPVPKRQRLSGRHRLQRC